MGGTPRNEWPTTPCFTGGLTNTEGRSQFSLWSMMAAPLVASTDLRADSAFTIKTLTNRDVIAVDQDPLGKQGTPRAGGGVSGRPLAPEERIGLSVKSCPLSLWQPGTGQIALGIAIEGCHLSPDRGCMQLVET